MTQRDRWAKRKCVQKYWTYKDHVQAFILKHQLDIGASLEVVFYLPMPKSWSKRKRAEYDNRPHQQKPDIDNLCKALMDALFDDDCHIYNLNARKFWSTHGEIKIIA